jgi:hypothetical protein
MVLQGLFPNWPGFVTALLSAHVPALVKMLPRWPEVIIAAVQVFIAFFKFALYHYWVYVEPKPAIEDAAPALETEEAEPAS